MRKSYTSIKEIEKDLKVAKLKNEVAKEEIKMYKNTIKNGIYNGKLVFSIIKFLKDRR